MQRLGDARQLWGDHLYNDPDMTLGMYRDEGWVVGLLFGDGFESGDFTAWSAVVP